MTLVLVSFTPGMSPLLKFNFAYVISPLFIFTFVTALLDNLSVVIFKSAIFVVTTASVAMALLSTALFANSLAPTALAAMASAVTESVASLSAFIASF